MTAGPYKAGDASPRWTGELEPDEVRRALDRAVRRICPAWLSASRDDLVQAAMMKVLKLGQRPQEGSRAWTSSYLWKVAYSTLVDEIRKRRRRPEEPLDESVSTRLDPATDPDPERQALGSELGEAIRTCLRGMVETRRLAVTLHLQGHTVPESAALMGWPLKRADNLVYRGLASLRECLRGMGIAP